MNFIDMTRFLRENEFPLIARALDRHMCWALEHAAVGEDDAAAAVLLDVRAIASEITEYDGNRGEDVVI